MAHVKEDKFNRYQQSSRNLIDINFNMIQKEKEKRTCLNPL